MSIEKCIYIVIIFLLCNFSYACDLKVYKVSAISATPFINNKSTGEETLQEIFVTLFQNEYEPYSFVLYNDGNTECKNIEIDYLKIVSQKDIDITRDFHIDFRIVKRWYQAGGAWKTIGKSGPRKYVPELLVYDDKLIKVDHEKRKNYLKVKAKDKSTDYIDISRDNSGTGVKIHEISEFDVQDLSKITNLTILPKDIRQIWITVRSLDGLTGGGYRTKIKISAEKSDVIYIPININLMNLNLETPEIFYSIFYRGRLTNQLGTISSEKKNLQQFMAEMVNMKRHGIEAPVCYQSLDNKKLFEEYMQMRRHIFGNDRIEFLTGLSASIATTKNKTSYLIRQMKYLKENRKSFGVSDFYLFGKDEAKGKALIEQRNSWSIVKQHGFNIFATGYGGTYAAAGDLLDVFVLAGKPLSSDIKKFQNVGKKVFTYAYPQVGPENPLLFRRNYGVRIWQAGVDGVMPYAYQTSYQSTWNDFDHSKYREHNFTYPTSVGVIDTIAWEGFREAVDDVRYLRTLEKMIENLDNNPKCGLRAECIGALTNVKRYLVNLKKEKTIDVQQIRNSVIRYINQLNNLKNV